MLATGIRKLSVYTVQQEYTDRYRTVSESLIVEMLVLSGSIYEFHEGGQPAAAAIETSHKALQSWIDQGLGYRLDDVGQRQFDPVEVVNFFKMSGLKGHDRFWIDRCVPTGRRLVTDLMAPAQAGAVRAARRRFDVEIRRTLKLDPSRRGVAVRLRAPLPLPNVHLTLLRVKSVTPSGTTSGVRLSPGRLEFRDRSQSSTEVEIGALVSFAAYSRPTGGVGFSGATEDLDLYLVPREGLIVVTDRIAELSLRLAGLGDDALAAVHSFWTFMIEELTCGAVHYDQVDLQAPGDWVLDVGWFDCRLGSALLVSLCRARGIPARIVAGYVLYKLAPTNHYWSEVWITGKGWTPFDLLSWDLSAGGRDRTWRDHFFGRLDFRMTTECFPLAFTGSIGVPFPPVWHVIQVPSGKGVEIDVLCVSGNALCSDIISVLDSGETGP